MVCETGEPKERRRNRRAFRRDVALQRRNELWVPDNTGSLP
jgi:hypothetical protein